MTHRSSNSPHTPRSVFSLLCSVVQMLEKAGKSNFYCGIILAVEFSQLEQGRASSFVQRPVGTLTPWWALWLAKISCHRAGFCFKARKQGVEELKSSFPSDYISYNMLVLLWNRFPPTPNKMYTSFQYLKRVYSFSENIDSRVQNEISFFSHWVLFHFPLIFLSFGNDTHLTVCTHVQ